MVENALIVMIGPFPIAKVRGGITSVIASYFKSSLIEDYEVQYIHTSSSGGYFQKIKAFLQALKKLYHFIKTREVLVVHIHTASWRSFYRKMFFVYLSKVMKTRVLLHVHGGEFNLFYNANGGLHKKIITSVLDVSDSIVVLSESWLPNIQKMTNNLHLSALMNPVNLKEYPNRDIEKSNGREHFEIVFLGALSRAKGVYDLIESFPEILYQVPMARLHLCGIGPIEEMKELCKELKIENVVTFHGWVSGKEKISIVINSDMLILPSYNEGLPVSVIEAMAAGLPVVCTPVGGVPDIFENGLNGFLFPPGDKKALVRQVVKLAKDPSLRIQMSKTNRNTAEDLFDLEKIIERLGSVYQEMIARLVK